MLSSVNFYNYTANKTTSTEYRFGCANCHPMDEATYHMNGTIDISLNKNTAGIGSLRTKNSVTTDTAGYTQVVNTTVTCSAAYCHSNGVTTPTYATTINWYATSLATDKCQICHGNSPGAAGQIAGSAAHGAHVVGIHYKGIFNGKSGFLPQSATKGGAVNAAHGTDSRATTINCNLCHNDTVTQAANDYNSACVSCHGATIVKNSGDLIANKTFHVNGAINIKLANTKIVSKAQIRPTSFTSYTAATAGNWARNKSFYKNYTSAYDVSRTAMQVTDYNVSTGCSNLSCHNGKTVKWTDTVTCKSCHTRL